jgi:hypothetical protein
MDAVATPASGSAWDDAAPEPDVPPVEYVGELTDQGRALLVPSLPPRRL